MEQQEQPTRGKEATRQRIVEAAIGVFAEKGYHDAVVDEIVRASGTSKGSFYFHFPSKEDIFFALIEGLASRLAGSVDEAVAGEGGGVARVDAAIRAVFHTVSRHRKLAKILLVHTAGLGHPFDRRLMEIHGRFAQLIKAHLDRAMASRDIPPVDTQVAAYAWLGAVNELVIRWLHTGEPADLQSLLPDLRALLLRSLGLAVGPDTGSPQRGDQGGHGI
ncbi:MAG: TetR/AcrR family transcriptional regulator [Chloroflexi bacterium]|nr:TetR/AcrR family transcriptional regulator [Chloroflexota bacterium]